MVSLYISYVLNRATFINLFSVCQFLLAQYVCGFALYILSLFFQLSYACSTLLISACTCSADVGARLGSSASEHTSLKCTETNSSDRRQFPRHGIMKNQLLLKRSRSLAGVWNYLWLQTFVFVMSQLSLAVHSRKINLTICQPSTQGVLEIEKKNRRGKRKSSSLSIHACVYSFPFSVSQHVFFKCLLCVTYLAISSRHSETKNLCPWEADILATHPSYLSQ